MLKKVHDTFRHFESQTCDRHTENCRTTHSIVA